MYWFIKRYNLDFNHGFGSAVGPTYLQVISDSEPVWMNEWHRECIINVTSKVEWRCC